MKDWSVDVDGSLIICQFPEGMPQREFHKNALKNEWRDSLQNPDANVAIIVVDMCESFFKDTYVIWQIIAREGVNSGVNEWAVVADDEESTAIQQCLESIDELTVQTFNQRKEAFKWAIEKTAEQNKPD